MSCKMSDYFFRLQQAVCKIGLDQNFFLVLNIFLTYFLKGIFIKETDTEIFDPQSD